MSVEVAVIATCVPLLVLMGLAALARSLRRLAPLLLLDVVWGMFATYLVLRPNDFLISKVGVSLAVTTLIPLVEETVKALPSLHRRGAGGSLTAPCWVLPAGWGLPFERRGSMFARPIP